MFSMLAECLESQDRQLSAQYFMSGTILPKTWLNFYCTNYFRFRACHPWFLLSSLPEHWSKGLQLPFLQGHHLEIPFSIGINLSILNWNKLLHSSVSFYLYPFLPTFKFHFRIFAYFEYHFSVFANFIFANFRCYRQALAFRRKIFDVFRIYLSIIFRYHEILKTIILLFLCIYLLFYSPKAKTINQQPVVIQDGRQFIDKIKYLLIQPREGKGSFHSPLLLTVERTSSPLELWRN